MHLAAHRQGVPFYLFTSIQDLLSAPIVEQYDADNVDYDALVRRMAGTSPELILGATYLEDSMAIARAVRAQGLAIRQMALSSNP